MKRTMTLMLGLAALLFTACNASQTTTVYDFTSISNTGDEVDFSAYKGKVLLLVNTLGFCLVVILRTCKHFTLKLMSTKMIMVTDTRS